MQQEFLLFRKTLLFSGRWVTSTVLFPAYILTYSSDVFPLLLVQHFMVRALTFKWEQPEQILRHSQAFQKEIYFYSINAARGCFIAAKLGLIICDNSMYVLIRGDYGGIEGGRRVCNLLFEQACK